MKDIEVMRRELETAKRIRDDNYDCIHLNPYVRCCDCPVWKRCGGEPESRKSKRAITAFISTREAELVEIEKAQENPRGDGNAGPRDGLSHVQTAAEDIKSGDCVAETPEGYVRIPTATGHVFQSVSRVGVPDVIPAGDPSFVFADRIPTLDDFALALIKGGFMGSGAELYNRATVYKAESDRRRGI